MRQVHAWPLNGRAEQLSELRYVLHVLHHNNMMLFEMAGACGAGDGRHLLSNGKDQAAKLWDLRKMLSAAQHARLPHARVPNFEWDYRCGRPLHPAHAPLPACFSCFTGCSG